MNCVRCVHEKICGLWRAAESQDASCFIDDCFEEKAEARCETLEKMVREYQETIIPGYRERAEAAEACVHELETTHRVEMCEDGYDCVELGKARRDLMAAEEAAKAAAQKREIDWDAWKGCSCNSVQKACCTCVSLRCHFCNKGSEYKRGNYCSSCGRPLNGMARLKLEMRLKGE